MAGKTGLTIPQLLSTTCDYGTSQHFKDLGHFPGPHLERALPTQPAPTDRGAIFLAMATLSQLPRHRHSTSHIITRTRPDKTPMS
ncbi:hypothetical protein PAAG_11836 [Paracoccidioides lutzii Pb01]|uniref:Uncharacterized protein n=1 Tax=Paracoccidioides lutzii (strain ATCC MYA-826 / Pb01) TaxID=502779 RepID=A0A0A2V0Z4_PARBA|nr:hypothetical protein PAAG_11836 [Paracoccidioides lutzii Pb01]KGQ01486.1 hypothetical protein PAAG_11836 [Paracoccidioides lutzii Pb01]